MNALSAADIEKIRQDFPQLKEKCRGLPLVYLDSAATSQKPQSVINKTSQYYSNYCANVHRGTYELSEKATAEYESTREKLKKLINAARVEEIIFTSGTTQSINLVAWSYARTFLSDGDEILISEMEHHSNIVPWQLIAPIVGAKIRVTPMNDRGELDISAYEKLLNKKTKIVAVSHVSNALGTINPIKEMIAKAHAVGAKVVIDGAQSMPHRLVDVVDLDCDFYAFSAHKMYGPTGIGALYAKAELLEKMPPYFGGGDMISSVSFEKTTYAQIPHKFEAGTPNIAGVIGFGAAIDYINNIGIDAIEAHEQSLLKYATTQMSQVLGLQIIGQAKNKAALISFVLKRIHPHDVSSILDRQGVAIRAGHLCAQPVMKHFGVPSLSRASFAVYNTKDEIDVFINALNKVCEVMNVR